MKYEIFSIKTSLKKEIKNLKAIFSLSNGKEPNIIKSLNDRLVQQLLEENKTKYAIIKILAGNFSVNVNKPQSTDFSLQLSENYMVVNSETLKFSEESVQKLISSIPKEPIKSNKGDTKNNHCT